MVGGTAGLRDGRCLPTLAPVPVLTRQGRLLSLPWVWSPGSLLRRLGTLINPHHK